MTCEVLKGSSKDSTTRGPFKVRPLAIRRHRSVQLELGLGDVDKVVETCSVEANAGVLLAPWSQQVRTQEPYTRET